MDILRHSLEVLQQSGYQFAVLLKHPKESYEDIPRFDGLILSDNLDSGLQEQIRLLTLKITTVYSLSQNSGSSTDTSTGSIQSNPRITETIPLVTLCVSTSSSAEKYFNLAFRLLRQLPCKQISKCWIKVIEPKKKARYPYTLGEKSKPTWWPKGVEHREPDHLQKPDRLTLMITIMSVVAPLWYENNKEIYKDMRDATHALFKNDKEGFLKDLILENVYKVSHAIAETNLGNKVDLQVLDLSKIKSAKQYSEMIKRRQQNRIQPNLSVNKPSISAHELSSKARIKPSINSKSQPIPGIEETDEDSYHDSEETISSQLASEYYDSNEEAGVILEMYNQLQDVRHGEMDYNDVFESYLEDGIHSSKAPSKSMLL
ncbi:HBR037Wp [Eremothecium sinecaudum]|uniref:HBR037Wp n=1 Tax=Eremothecium sinecaudum TaxID=45286 RepID=A0A109UWU2_9SACH|nr:HBR037Wp [Eremothecium sinecaudum]AMD18938.1 HBR037Wp [Eremothecium sinecaudum]